MACLTGGDMSTHDSRLDGDVHSLEGLIRLANTVVTLLETNIATQMSMGTV